MNKSVELETDYLVIGSGAVGMAFADVLLTESNADVVVVDLHDRPGGHWNDAYPFVRLHQPSALYVVNSKQLGNRTKDATGLNAGLDELATAAEILSYHEQVMRQQFLPTGRARYFPQSRYGKTDGVHTITSLASGQQRRVSVRGKVVDTRAIDIQVPSTHPLPFEVADGVRCIPLNDLPKITVPPSGFAVVGSGKTGIDACFWLLAHEVDPDDIMWIMPRDSWLLDRARFQDGGPATGLGFTVEQLEQSAVSTSLPDLYARLEAAGHFLRLDPEVEPTKFCCATVTLAELAELRRIKNVVWLGRVQRIEHDRITLDDGEVPAEPGWSYVDCSASAFRQRQLPPIFEGDIVMPQAVRQCMLAFSGALVALVELQFHGDDVKNSLCTVVPLLQVPSDWARMQITTLANALAWSREPVTRSSLAESRLSQFPTRESPEDAELLTSLHERFRDVVGPSVANLTRLLESA